MGQNTAPLAIDHAIEISDPFIRADWLAAEQPRVLTSACYRSQVSVYGNARYLLRHRIVAQHTSFDRRQDVCSAYRAFLGCHKAPILCDARRNPVAVIRDHRRIEVVLDLLKLRDHLALRRVAATARVGSALGIIGPE